MVDLFTVGEASQRVALLGQFKQALVQLNLVLLHFDTSHFCYVSIFKFVLIESKFLHNRIIVKDLMKFLIRLSILLGDHE